jgi:hypothetical protein
MPQDPRHDTPTTPEANRAREQGAGMGQRDLEAQRAPNETVAGEDRTIGDAVQDEVEAELDTGDDRRVIKAESQGGQGPKTRSRNKQIVSGKPYD